MLSPFFPSSFVPLIVPISYSDRPCSESGKVSFLLLDSMEVICRGGMSGDFHLALHYLCILFRIEFIPSFLVFSLISHAERLEISAPVLVTNCYRLYLLILFCRALNTRQFIGACEPDLSGKQKNASANQSSCAFNSVSRVQCLVRFTCCHSLVILLFVCVCLSAVVAWFDSDGLFRTMIDDVKAGQSFN